MHDFQFPTLIHFSPKIQRPKRQASSDYDAYNYDYTNDEDSEDSEDYESSGEMYTDLDQAAYDTEDDNEDIYTSSNTEVTPVIPVSRVVPTLVSPSFDDPGSFGNVVVTDSMPVPRNSAFDVIKTALYDDEFEGRKNPTYFDDTFVVLLASNAVMGLRRQKSSKISNHLTYRKP